MQFSISRILFITAFISFVLAATFGLPLPIGFLLLSVLSLFVIPPFILVGIVNTRGLRQSFFIGAMVTGIPHFLISAYFGYFAVMMMLSDGGIFSADYADADFDLSHIHLVGYVLGTIGGLSGMAAYGFLKLGEKKPASIQEPAKPQPVSASEVSTSINTPPEIYQDADWSEDQDSAMSPR